ncbi:PLP-dependent aminotransferase family protein [Planomonospora sp. ID67723]|uniref:MocR-like pyridoxine biosynthesis transcription factor PdxR n=1 Tax=Planomonospora sp. ID67723 TaxID=2738134 RepID=UPI0018C3F5E1|nr:PLP-dependent aminotransferase family protein [Planomonospora sp. ID67723]MBG0826204.1 PLP-dependent aminotransferase family protein [Planomonospora sp. ID67723]
MADLHLAVDRAAGGIAGQIARELREAVRHGRLAAGERLPASRELARDLGLSRGVVVEAYEQLVAEGFLTSKVGAGTRVAPMARRVPAVSPPAAGNASGAPGAETPGHECDYGRRPTSPDLGFFPRGRWLASTRRVLAALPADALDYGDPGGVPELREELAAYLRRVRGADIAPENLVIVGGVAQGLNLTVQALAGRLPGAGRTGEDLGWFVDGTAHPPRPGRVRLAVEDPTGLRQLPLLRSAGADLVAVPVDGEGVDVGALAATGVRAVLLTPAHHYPTGVVLSPRRRAELIEWAAATGATVLEDDYDAEFRFDRDPVGCLQGLAPDRVVLAGSVSKSLAPGLRLGWVAAPPEIAAAVRLARAELDMGSPVLEQHTLADFVRSGAYDRHLRRMRREYRTRRDTLVRALAEHLPQITVHGVSAGLHLLAELPRGWDERAAARAAQARGLAAEPVGPMRRRPGPPALVMGFARLPVHRADEVVRGFARGLHR